MRPQRTGIQRLEENQQEGDFEHDADLENRGFRIILSIPMPLPQPSPLCPHRGSALARASRMINSPNKTQIRLMFSDTPIGKWAAPSISGSTAKWRCTMKRQRGPERIFGWYSG